jgi:GH24 family phage-related lysozyme (muramidase)
MATASLRNQRMSIEQYIWPATVLVIFLGMLVVVLRALTIAHDLAKIVLLGGGKLPAAEPAAPAKPSILSKLVPTPTLPAPEPATASSVVDQAFIDFVKAQEGFEPKAKWDYKQYTNGYGTKALSSTEVIDKATAETRLQAEIVEAVAAMHKFIPDAPIGVQQGMVDAVFNLGTGWEHQELGTLLQQGKYEEAKSHLMQYVHAGGVVLQALVKRRAAECAMFDHPL